MARRVERVIPPGVVPVVPPEATVEDLVEDARLRVGDIKMLFEYLLLNMRPRSAPERAGTMQVYPDGRMEYNPYFVINDLTTPELRAGVVLHELMHLAYQQFEIKDTIAGWRDLDRELWALSTDYYINNHIENDAKQYHWPVALPPFACINHAWDGLDEIDIYDIMLKDPEKYKPKKIRVVIRIEEGPEDKKRGSGNIPGIGDIPLPGSGKGEKVEAGKLPKGVKGVTRTGPTSIEVVIEIVPVTGGGESSEQGGGGPGGIDWGDLMRRALDDMRSQGLDPGGLGEIIDRLDEPKLPWNEILRRRMWKLALRWQSRAGMLRRYRGWTRVSPALAAELGEEDIPATKHRARPIPPPVIVAVDTSGSIASAELARFGGEAVGIARALRMAVDLFVCDAETSTPTKVFDAAALKAAIAKGHTRGGTDFRPVFEYIREHNMRPSSLVYFTDMCGTFPDEQPPYPVIWCRVGRAPDEPEWGDVEIIQLPLSSVRED